MVSNDAIQSRKSAPFRTITPKYTVRCIRRYSALQFGISENTVRKAASAIFSKLGVANRTEAAAMALRNNLVKA